MITLEEDILKKYKFVAPSQKCFLKYKRIVDDLPKYLTVKGAEGYGTLISLLYDIGKLVDYDVNEIVERLDNIVEER